MECIKCVQSTCECASIYVYKVNFSFYVLNTGSGLSSKLCNWKDKDVTQCTDLKEKQVKEIKVQK